MSWLANIIRLFLGVAMLATPVASVRAQVSNISPALMVTATTSQVHGAEAQLAKAGVMDDCDQMKADGKTNSCPCCDPSKACAVEVCLIKCFTFSAAISINVDDYSESPLRIVPTVGSKPPDWNLLPHLPPPRR